MNNRIKIEYLKAGVMPVFDVGTVYKKFYPNLFYAIRYPAIDLGGFGISEESVNHLFSKFDEDLEAKLLHLFPGNDTIYVYIPDDYEGCGWEFDLDSNGDVRCKKMLTAFQVIGYTDQNAVIRYLDQTALMGEFKFSTKLAIIDRRIGNTNA